MYLDPVDRQIINLLQERGRRTNADIARSIGMSESTVKNRIDRLTENGILKVLAVLNPQAVGYQCDILVGIRVVRGEMERVGEALAAMNEVVYLGYVTGRYDLLIEALLKDQNELFNFLTKTLGEIPGIVSTETFYVMQTKKINYEWKLPAELMSAEGPEYRDRNEGGRNATARQKEGK